MGSTKPRKELEYKDAYVSLNRAELGWAAPSADRTVRVVFLDGDGGRLGVLSISKAAVRWKGRYRKKDVKVPTRRLDELFEHGGKARS